MRDIMDIKIYEPILCGKTDSLNFFSLKSLVCIECHCKSRVANFQGCQFAFDMHN